MTEYGIILFHTTSSAMRTEKMLVKEGFAVKLIPTPRELSSDCGVALRFDWAQREPIEKILGTAGTEIVGIYHLN